jgi:hypothetical protein
LPKPSPDLTGNKFGKFTVISLAKHKTGKGQIWLVRCDCGNESYKSTSDITRVSKRSAMPMCHRCSGQRNIKKAQANRKSIDITGQEFGKLTAIKPIRKGRYGTVWLVKCNCGTEFHRPVSQLNVGRKHNHVQMCKYCLVEQRDRSFSVNYRLDRIKLREHTTSETLKIDPLIDHNIGSHEAFRRELMYDLEQEICPCRNWVDEREIPGLSADIDDTITTSNFQDYVDVNIEKSEVQIEDKLEEDMTYRVKPDGTIETDDIEEALRLSRILCNAPERTRATEQEIVETIKRHFADQQFTSNQIASKLGFDSGTAVREGLRLLHNKKLVKKHRSNDGTCFIWELVK